MHLFDNDIACPGNESFKFNTVITENWSINGVPNGGYLMAILANVMLSQTDKKMAQIITANYLSRCIPGKATLSVEKIALSKQYERLQVSLFQAGVERIRSIGTLSNKKVDGAYCKYEGPVPEMSAFEDCIPLPVTPHTLYDQLDIRLDPDSTGWMTGTLSDKSEHKGWVKFRDERQFDPPAIALIADAFPPPIFATQGIFAWVPTIEFSVNIRNLPKTMWLKCVFRTRFISGGLLEEDGEIWDTSGQIIAISRQIAQYRNE